MKTLAVAALALLMQGAAWAQAVPTGLWRTIDDETNQEKSLVRISEAAGVVTAKVEKVLDPTKQGMKCEKCADERKDQLVLGMTIIKNVKQNASDKALWDGGEILDPNNGKTYKVRLKPMDGGKSMEVRGYIGVPLIGRTQTWIRVE
jgi:uncharacterized protein (DUF2147 family)